jgi:ribonuclease HI
MVEMWTDGALRGKNNGRAVSLLLRDGNYLGLLVYRYKVRVPYEAELLGIIQAFKYLNTIAVHDDVEIYTDAESIVTVFRSLGGKKGLPEDLRFKRLWHEFFKERKNRKVTMEYFNSHLAEHNPNKVCDIIGRLSYNTNIVE